MVSMQAHTPEIVSRMISNEGGKEEIIVIGTKAGSNHDVVDLTEEATKSARHNSNKQTQILKGTREDLLRGQEPKFSFSEQLFDVLDNEEHHDVLQWTERGDAFSIVNPKKFTLQKMANLFNIRNMSSFVRKLTRWGFVRVFNHHSNYSDAFHHPDFCRGQRERAKRKVRCLGKIIQTSLQQQALEAKLSTGVTSVGYTFPAMTGREGWLTQLATSGGSFSNITNNSSPSNHPALGSSSSLSQPSLEQVTAASTASAEALFMSYQNQQQQQQQQQPRSVAGVTSSLCGLMGMMRGRTRAGFSPQHDDLLGPNFNDMQLENLNIQQQQQEQPQPEPLSWDQTFFHDDVTSLRRVSTTSSTTPSVWGGNRLASSAPVTGFGRADSSSSSSSSSSWSAASQDFSRPCLVEDSSSSSSFGDDFSTTGCGLKTFVRPTSNGGDNLWNSWDILRSDTTASWPNHNKTTTNGNTTKASFPFMLTGGSTTEYLRSRQRQAAIRALMQEEREYELRQQLQASQHF